MKAKIRKVTTEELLFIKANWLYGLPTLIAESLKNEDEVSLTRHQVHRELTTIKEEYDTRIVDKALELIKTIKGIDFTN